MNFRNYWKFCCLGLGLVVIVVLFALVFIFFKFFGDERVFLQF